MGRRPLRSTCSTAARLMGSTADNTAVNIAASSADNITGAVVATRPRHRVPGTSAMVSWGTRLIPVSAGNYPIRNLARTTFFTIAKGVDATRSPLEGRETDLSRIRLCVDGFFASGESQATRLRQTPAASWPRSKFRERPRWESRS